VPGVPGISVAFHRGRLVPVSEAIDDLGTPVPLPESPQRVISLVPSLTEAVAMSVPGVLIGATDWCTHPGDLDAQGVVRLGGTKNPNLDAIADLAADLVIANEEENRGPDIEELRRRGVPVYVTDIRTVDQALSSIARLLRLFADADADGAVDTGWLDAAGAAWADPPRYPPVQPGRSARALVPIWRRPWMALGSDTYAGDVLRRLGIDNILADSPQRYPRFDPADPHLAAVDVVVFPDEPYRFHAADGPEAFAHRPYALIDGRSLTWYGPAMVEAPQRLAAALAAVQHSARD
jgi:ABC-type Fe3+-hydroxamate transport system substrate-binding protein